MHPRTRAHAQQFTLAPPAGARRNAGGSATVIPSVCMFPIVLSLVTARIVSNATRWNKAGHYSRALTKEAMREIDG